MANKMATGMVGWIATKTTTATAALGAQMTENHADAEYDQAFKKGFRAGEEARDAWWTTQTSAGGRAPDASLMGDSSEREVSAVPPAEHFPECNDLCAGNRHWVISDAEARAWVDR